VPMMSSRFQTQLLQTFRRALRASKERAALLT
jgi:hypothetical protein